MPVPVFIASTFPSLHARKSTEYSVDKYWSLGVEHWPEQKANLLFWTTPYQTMVGTACAVAAVLTAATAVTALALALGARLLTKGYARAAAATMASPVPVEMFLMVSPRLV